MRLFVTGTDTGVGKTHVAAALARRYVAQGHRVFAFKPIETGCRPDSLGDDQAELVAAAGGWQAGELAGMYRFALPAAPLVAARAEGRTINVQAIEELIAGTPADVTIVEGAGGWRVPITPSVDMAALAARLAFPVVIVARAGLGTINHTLLTVEAVERDGCVVSAVILSARPDDTAEFASSNADQIRARWGGIVSVHRDGDSGLAMLDPDVPRGTTAW